MSKYIDDCWERAYQLIEARKDNEAIALCETEPCASNSIDCQNYLGWRYYEKKDRINALVWFERGADNGSLESLFGMASVNFDEKEFVSALNLFKKASDKGYFRACHWAGYMYEHGLGVDKNTELALAYYKAGAENGYLLAERSIIHMVFKTGTLMNKLSILPRLVALSLRGFFIARKDINDERIVDVPNVFEKR